MTENPDVDVSAFRGTSEWKRAILWRRLSFVSIFFIAFGFQLRSTTFGLSFLIIGIGLVLIALVLTERELRRAMAMVSDPKATRRVVNRILNREALGLSPRPS